MLTNCFHNTEPRIILFGSFLGSLTAPKTSWAQIVMVVFQIWHSGDHHRQEMDELQKIAKNSKKLKLRKREPRFFEENKKRTHLKKKKNIFVITNVVD